jgi:hypothetical protein
VTYFYRTITVKSPRYISLMLGSDGGMQVWMNGAKVQSGVFRGTAAKPDQVLVRLNSGLNHLLLKVHHGNGAGGFYFGLPEGPVLSYPVEFATAIADYQQKDHPVKAAIDDKPETGWAVDGQDEKLRSNHQAIFVTKAPILFAGGAVLKLRLKFEAPFNGHNLGRLRLAATDAAGGWEDLVALPQSIQTAVFSTPDGSPPGQKTELRDYYRDNFYPELKALNEKLAGARKAQTDLNGRIATIRVMEEMPQPRATHIRVRGDYRNLGEQVAAGVPHILPPLPPNEQTNRLTLAKWLVNPDHPLLARVTINRFWALYFGLGFVRTGNEFGTQGELPSHPDLFDWLARDFIGHKFDLKHLHRTILNSRVYQLSWRPNDGNRLDERLVPIELSAKRRRSYVRTTQSNHVFPMSPNVLDAIIVL